MADRSPGEEETVSLFERRAHSCVLYKGRLYYWGGLVLLTQRLPDDSSSEEDSDDDEDTLLPSVPGIPPGVLRVRKSLPITEKKLIDVYDIRDKLWYQYGTSGDVPPPDYGATMCVLNDHIYLYGGYNDFHFSSDLYRLDLSTMIWKMMEPSTDIKPSPVYCTAMLSHKTRLVTFGGICGVVPEEKQAESNSTYHEYESMPRPHGCNNEYHEFSLEDCSWTSPHSENRPSPVGGHSMVHFDRHRAILFGGRTRDDAFSNDLYVLNLESREWIHVQPKEGSPWPKPRMHHCLCCLVDPWTLEGEDFEQLIFITSGRKKKDSLTISVTEEYGILSLDSKLMKPAWKEMLIPLLPRYWPTAIAYYVRNSKSVLLFLFGGNFPMRTERFGEIVRSPVTGLRKWRGDFRILEWGRDFPTLQSLCMDAISNNFNILSKRLLQLRGSPLLTEVEEYHRKKSYYPHIPLESRPDDLNYGVDRVHFLCGVGYGRAIPTPAR